MNTSFHTLELAAVRQELLLKTSPFRRTLWNTNGNIVRMSVKVRLQDIASSRDPDQIIIMLRGSHS